jgi:hypothetical protein
MRSIFQALIINTLLFTVFGLVYALLPKNHFICNQPNYKPKLLDYIGFSITTQAGVGITNLMPTSDLAKILLIIQQYSMIAFNIILLYVFIFIHKKKMHK